MCLSLLCSVFSSNSSRYSTRMEILLYLVSFCSPKSKIHSFSHIQFSQLPWDILSRSKEIIQFLVFLSVLHIKLSCFLLIFLLFWPFIYSTFNKWCLETWSCVCGYCAYGLFLYLYSLWNIPKNARELGVGSQAISFRRQWVKHVTFCLISKDGRYSCLLNKSITHHSVTLSLSAITEKNVDNENNAMDKSFYLKLWKYKSWLVKPSLKAIIKVPLWSNSRHPLFYIFIHNRSFLNILPNFNLLRTLELVVFGPLLQTICGRH